MIATRASEVMGAEVEEERMTWRKGWSRDGISKFLISAGFSLTLYVVNLYADLCNL